MKHFENTHTRLAAHEYARRGVTVREGNKWGVELLLHNGCGSGNMVATMPPIDAVAIAGALLQVALEVMKRDQAKQDAARAIRLKLPTEVKLTQPEPVK